MKSSGTLSHRLLRGRPNVIATLGSAYPEEAIYIDTSVFGICNLHYTFLFRKYLRLETLGQARST
jgi:hypothetical protein